MVGMVAPFFSKTEFIGAPSFRNRINTFFDDGKGQNMISSQIHQILKASSLRHQDLAELMGVKLQRVRRLASGTVQKMTREESEALIRKLNIRADWLLTGRGEMFEGGSAAEPTSPPHPRRGAAALGAPFMGKVLEAVMKAYEECGVRIGPRGAGEQAMLIYSDILDALGPGAVKERDVALKMEVYRLKRRLSHPDVSDENKRSA